MQDQTVEMAQLNSAYALMCHPRRVVAKLVLTGSFCEGPDVAAHLVCGKGQ